MTTTRIARQTLHSGAMFSNPSSWGSCRGKSLFQADLIVLRPDDRIVLRLNWMSISTNALNQIRCQVTSHTTQWLDFGLKGVDCPPIFDEIMCDRLFGRMCRYAAGINLVASGCLQLTSLELWPLACATLPNSELVGDGRSFWTISSMGDLREFNPSECQWLVLVQSDYGSVRHTAKLEANTQMNL